MTKKVAMAEAEKPKRRGRPRIPAEQKKRTNLTFRVRDELREKVQQAADGSSRSLSEEVEFRLETSFDRENVVSQFLGGEHNKGFFRMLGLVIDDLEQRTKGKWRENAETNVQVAAAVIAILQAVNDMPADEIISKANSVEDKLWWHANAVIFARLSLSMEIDEAVRRVDENLAKLMRK